MKHYPAIALMIVVCGCTSHRLTVSSGSIVSRKEIADAVNQARVGMSAKAMLSKLVPVSNTSPVFRSLPDNTVQYVFGIGDNSQIWVNVANPDNLPPLGPSTPNGRVTAIGKVEPKQIWTYVWEDSNQLN